MIYTVYHKVLDGREIWGPFSPEEVQRRFTPYAVSKHPKHLVNAPAPVVEAELAWHNPLLQERGFLETSCYVHVLRNKLHEAHEHVGVTQYDMRWTEEAARMLRGAGPRQAFGIIHGVICQNGVANPLAFPNEIDWGRMLRSYNTRFDAAYSLRDFEGLPFTFFQSYVLPREVFAELAGWLEVLCEQLYPWANRAPFPDHWGHLAGWTERAEAIFVGLRQREGQIELSNLPLIHDIDLASRLNIPVDHYADKTAPRSPAPRS
jgi:hypothetical protein